ncbi:MAG: VTT domain-containing protein [Burkholderiales bacterium]|nr:VTT domain-containing protein [Burkholderiales bacterium]
MTSPWLRRALDWARLGPALRSGLWVLALFAAGLWVAQHYARPIEQALHAHAAAGVAVFVATSALAVVLPLASNLPLVPIAVLAWGPGWTAMWLLLGWIAGSMIAFTLGRYARGSILRRFPSVQRHADIDRLIHPRWRLASLISLRMTFPVDVLSYALGLFSRSTSLAETTLSTAVGAAPFAFVFAWFPTMSGAMQWAVLAASTAVFIVHLWWVLRGTGPRGRGGERGGERGVEGRA